ncbi:MAG: hypothetical protein LUF87_00595, partial [Alistipes sp.]|nr:hypothetical protein [Alistipes sp.]
LVKTPSPPARRPVRICINTALKPTTNQTVTFLPRFTLTTIAHKRDIPGTNEWHSGGRTNYCRRRSGVEVRPAGIK